MNNLASRSVTAVFFVIAMVGSALLGQNVFSILLLIITILSINEFISIVSNNTVQPARWPTMVVGSIIYIIFAANAMGFMSAKGLLASIPFIFLLFIAELWRNKTNPFTNIAFSLVSIIYIALPFGLMMYFFDPVVISGPYHYGIVLGFLFVLWLNDTGAYFVGSLIGKHKLFERISPGKTWEGSMGGALFALLTAWVLSFIFRQLDVTQWMILSIIIVISGTLGDLVESLLKRSLGIKDSGAMLPGHGGLLDRFDAVLLSVPFVFVYLALFCR
ncbi:MAG: phosphatidate cytidylyltransferase [Lentimicrobiaceae bacterium]